MENSKFDIYYAHHQYKYNTKVEEYELDLIRRYFPSAKICNPSEYLNTEGKTEGEIMQDCYDAIDHSDILVFSSMDGVIGKGVWQEISYASNYNKLILYLYQNKLHTDVHFEPIIYRESVDTVSVNDRVAATVSLRNDR